MKNRGHGIRIMVSIMAMIWTTPTFAQLDPTRNPGDSELHLSSRAAPVQTAGIIDKLAWAGISLIDPASTSKPIFLYGYNVSDFNSIDADARERVLAGNISGTVNMAAIEPCTSAPSGGWCARNLRDQEILLNSMDELCTSNHSNCWIALSRPLSDHLLSNTIEERQFVAQPDFWSLHRQHGQMRADE